ncbi:hypothetical protein ISCGN_024275 [Ixodes scapularis]
MYVGEFEWQLLENSTVYGVGARCRVSESFYDVMIVGGRKLRDHATLRCKNVDRQFCRSKHRAVGERLSSQVLGGEGADAFFSVAYTLNGHAICAGNIAAVRSFSTYSAKIGTPEVVPTAFFRMKMLVSSFNYGLH